MNSDFVCIKSPTLIEIMDKLYADFPGIKSTYIIHIPELDYSTLGRLSLDFKEWRESDGHI